MRRGVRSVVLLAMVIASAGGATGCGKGEPAVLRFDGLYRTGPGSSGGTTFWRYLRLYPDGTALSASATTGPAQVASWLAQPFEFSGTWTREGDAIRISCRGPRGAVDYEGEVVENGLELAFRSRINGAEGEATWEFLPLDLGDGDS